MTSSTALSIRNDPIMQELWAVKAQINREANYSVDEIVRRMRIAYPQAASIENASSGRATALTDTHQAD